MVDVQINLDLLIQSLKQKGELPKHMEAAKVGKRFWFVCYDENQAQVISEDSSTGFGDDPNIALLKVLSERVERLAFRSGHAQGLKSCLTERSDGFAAYPMFYKDAVEKARETALCEAIERYVWATWWDNESIDFEIAAIGDATNDIVVSSYANYVKNECEITNFFVIRPKVQDLGSKEVVILFGHLKDGGFISGGACGTNLNQALLRSLDELYRHGLAVKKIKSQNIEPFSFYEKRLAFFGLGHGTHLINRRLNTKGEKSIILPALEIDEPVQHELQDLFQVYRCHFENQPPFIGGKMERMCL